jgi:hypothetical protein
MFLLVLSCVLSIPSKFGKDRESAVRVLGESPLVRLSEARVGKKLQQLEQKIDSLGEQLNKKLDGVLGVLTNSAPTSGKAHSTDMQSAFDHIYKTHEW